MDLQTWLDDNLGKIQLNPDPLHGINGQCVNAASSWSMAQGGPELLGDTAWDIFNNFRSPFYQVVSSSAGPQAGDIAFFLPNDSYLGTGPAGHVDVVLGLNSAGFLGADADWNVGGPHPEIQKISHTLAGVAGYFRKVESEVTQEQYQTLEAQVVDLKVWIMHLYEALTGVDDPSKVPTNVMAQLVDIKNWELNIDKDVKSG